jgi:hypothetical protein
MESYRTPLRNYSFYFSGVFAFAFVPHCGYNVVKRSLAGHRRVLIVGSGTSSNFLVPRLADRASINAIVFCTGRWLPSKRDRVPRGESSRLLRSLRSRTRKREKPNRDGRNQSSSENRGFPTQFPTQHSRARKK